MLWNVCFVGYVVECLFFQNLGYILWGEMFVFAKFGLYFVGKMFVFPKFGSYFVEMFVFIEIWVIFCVRNLPHVRQNVIRRSAHAMPNIRQCEERNDMLICANKF